MRDTRLFTGSLFVVVCAVVRLQAREASELVRSINNCYDVVDDDADDTDDHVLLQTSVKAALGGHARGPATLRGHVSSSPVLTTEALQTGDRIKLESGLRREKPWKAIDHPNLQSTRAGHSPGEVVYRLKVEALIGVFGFFFLCGCVLFTVSRHTAKSDSSAMLPISMALRVLLPFETFVCAMHVSAVIPASYELIQEMGKQPAQAKHLSCVLLSLVCLMTVVGVPMSLTCVRQWSQSRTRNAMLLMTLGLMASAMLHALAADPPTSWGLSPSLRLGLLFVSYIGIGLLSNPHKTLTRITAQLSTSREGVTPLMISFNCAALFGTGAGAFLNTFLVSDIHDAAGIRAQAARPLYVVFFMWGILGSGLWAVLPTECYRFAGPSTLANASAPGVRHKHMLSLRKRVVGITLCLSFVRSVVVSALVPATSFILLYEFHVSHRDLYITVCASFVVGTPLFLPVWQMLIDGRVTKTMLLRLLALSTFAITPLLFRTTSYDLHQGEAGMFLILFTDASIFVLLCIADGIADSLAVNFAVPESCFSQEWFAFLRPLVSDGAGRFIGPVVARYLINSGGRDLFACATCAVNLMIFCGVVKTASMLEFLQRSDEYSEVFHFQGA